MCRSDTRREVGPAIAVYECTGTSSHRKLFGSHLEFSLLRVVERLEAVGYRCSVLDSAEAVVLRMGQVLHFAVPSEVEPPARHRPKLVVFDAVTAGTGFEFINCVQDCPV